MHKGLIRSLKSVPKSLAQAYALTGFSDFLLKPRHQRIELDLLVRGADGPHLLPVPKPESGDLCVLPGYLFQQGFEYTVSHNRLPDITE